MAKPSVLIILAHPQLENSKANRAMVDAVRDLPQVTIHDLYREYPDFKIDVKKEQALLTKADVIVLQFPFYWYSAPALMKEWKDVVLTWGFAFGDHADKFKLKNKNVLVALTTGGPEEAYQPGADNSHSVVEFLRPYQQTATFCQMKYRAPFAIHAVEKRSAKEIQEHARAYRQLIETIDHLKS
jgi:glutathione-regulated potassium-efflux system ancillary protein KefG